jgi:hypothetical protein
VTEHQKELVVQLMRKTISNEQFAKEFDCSSSNIKDLLEVAYQEENADDVDYLLFLVFSFNLVTADYSDLLCRLMDAEWHYKHEDIASLFQQNRFHQGVDYLYNAALTQHEYLDFDEAFALAVKCIWALGAINTPDSIRKLELLTESENEVIRNNAVYQLDFRRKG